MTLRLIRSDAFPEGVNYPDEGCDFHPRCLTCPLLRCRFDHPRGLRGTLNDARDCRLAAMRRSGASVGFLQGLYGLSRRSVFRILAKSKVIRQE